jgi:hypothetical protein
LRGDDGERAIASNSPAYVIGVQVIGVTGCIYQDDPVGNPSITEADESAAASRDRYLVGLTGFLTMTKAS